MATSSDYSIRPVSLSIDSEPMRFSPLAVAVAAAIGLAAGVGIGLGVGAVVDRPLPAQSVLAGELDEALAEAARWKAVADRLPGVEHDLAEARREAVDLRRRVEQLRGIEKGAIAARDQALAQVDELEKFREQLDQKALGRRWMEAEQRAGKMQKELRALRARIQDGELQLKPSDATAAD